MPGTTRNRRLPLTRLAKTTQNHTKRKVSKYQALSPTTRQLKKAQDAVVVEAAYNKLLAIRAANGGKKRHTDIQNVLDEFKSKGIGEIERWHLEYRMKLGKIGKSLKGIQ